MALYTLREMITTVYKYHLSTIIYSAFFENKLEVINNISTIHEPFYGVNSLSSSNSELNDPHSSCSFIQQWKCTVLNWRI